MRSRTPACANTKSASAPRKRPAHGAVARKPSESNAPPRKPVSVKKKTRDKNDKKPRGKADEVAKNRFGAEALTAKPGGRPALEADDDESPRTTRRGAAARPAAAPKPARGGGEKRRGRLTVVTAFS